MKVYIAIVSCHKNTKVSQSNKQVDIRNKIRETWLRKIPSDIEYNFFVGNPKNDLLEKDIIYLDTDDTYWFLSDKIHKMFNYINSNKSFDYVFKCDDSTYLFPERIKEIITDLNYANFIGYSKNNGNPIHGGSGYILSKKCVEIISQSKKEKPVKMGEDVWITETLKDNGITYAQTKRLIPCNPPELSYQCYNLGSIEINNIQFDTCQQIERIYKASYDFI